MAAPARRQPKTITQPDGSTITIVLRGDEWHHWNTNLQGELLELDEMGFYRPATAAQHEAWQAQTKRAAMRADSIAMQPHIAEIPTSGTVHGLLILVEFQDVKFSMYNDPLQHYSDMMMKPGFDFALSPTSKYKHIGSVHEFFYENSGGIMDLQMDVVGPVTMPEKASYYASTYDGEAWKIFVEACQQLDDSIDFSIYDNDGDGKVDFLSSFYAGPGSNAAGVSSTAAIWPHQWTITAASGGQKFYFDDMQIDNYVCINEEYAGKPDGMGTFCHEFSHLFGLPDLYNYDACSPMDYDLMDSGIYLLNGYCPAPYSSYERYELGWLNPIELTTTGDYSLTALSSRNEAYIVPVTPDLEDPRTGEYYLFENRQNTRWDTYLPGHGMLVWHIDYVQNKWYNNQPNSWARHMCVDLVEADSIKGDMFGYIQDASATFPGTAGHTAFTSTTSPAFLGWEYPGRDVANLTVQLDNSITRIAENDGIISFHFTKGTDDSGLAQISADASKASQIMFLDGHFVIHTTTGNYNIIGERINLY